MSVRFRPSNAAGRSNGVSISSVAVKLPCRSGSPHGVRGGVHLVSCACHPLTTAVGGGGDPTGDPVCAPALVIVKAATAVAAPHERQNRLNIAPSNTEHGYPGT